MKTSKFQISLNYQQVLDLVLQLSERDTEKLRNELIQMNSLSKLDMSNEQLKSVLLDTKRYFGDKLGKYTHKKTSNDWNFYGLGFSKDDLGYVFGFNIGFFYKSDINLYKKVGMNVLIRTNGLNPEQRQEYLNFFRLKLSDWTNTPETNYYTVERNGKGIEIGRYVDISSFNTEDEISKYLYECIDGIHAIYKDIINQKNPIFEKVMRAAPPWKESLIDLCKKKIAE